MKNVVAYPVIGVLSVSLIGTGIYAHDQHSKVAAVENAISDFNKSMSSFSASSSPSATPTDTASSSPAPSDTPSDTSSTSDDAPTNDPTLAFKDTYTTPLNNKIVVSLGGPCKDYLDNSGTAITIKMINGSDGPVDFSQSLFSFSAYDKDSAKGDINDTSTDPVTDSLMPGKSAKAKMCVSKISDVSRVVFDNPSGDSVTWAK